MEYNGKERRQYARYDTDAKIYFCVKYDIKTKVEFQVLNKQDRKAMSEKYTAISKNVSVEGLCFVSHKELETGDLLLLEVYLPSEKSPILMEGEVRWSQAVPTEEGQPSEFITGIKLLTLNGKSISGTVHYDENNHIVWSCVLDAVFGNFRKLAKKMK